MSPRRKAVTAVLVAAALSASTAAGAHAQMGRIGDRLKKKVEDKVAAKGDTAVDKAMDGKKTPAKPGPAAEQQNEKATSTSSTAPSGRKEWANYDFVPGARAIFFTDFSDDKVGNFPKRLEFKTGQLEVVELDGQRALKASGPSELIIPLPEVLPSKFTVEIDVIGRQTKGVGALTFQLGGGRALRDDKFTEVGWGATSGMWLQGGGLERTESTPKDADVERYLGKPGSFRLLADGSALKIYVDEKRLANVPNAKFQRARALILRLEARDDEKEAVYVTRIRVAESAKDIYDELSEKGRWATQGILFETGKADVKLESTPTLKSIAAVLKEHSDLTLEIQGHTDNVGQASANLTLSQARADAVKQTLVTDYGVSANQLKPKGYGDTKPVAPNTTSEGRANNRRVEFVKQ